MSLSPTGPGSWSSCSEEEPPPLSLDQPQSTSAIAGYTTRLNLTEIVIRSLSAAKKSVLELFSAFDEEKDGTLPLIQMKKCLTKNGVLLTEKEFSTLFEGFIENETVNYISFLKSWGVIQQQLGSPLSRKRSTSDASIPNSPESVDAISGASYASYASYASSPFTSSPKRRVALHGFSAEQKQSLRAAIRLHLVRRFASAESIFQEVAERGALHTSDLCRYLNRHGVVCSLNQLCLLLAPFAAQPAVLTAGEFAAFVASVLGEEEVSGCLVDAFPSTFGTTTRIEFAPPAQAASTTSTISAASTTSIASPQQTSPLSRLSSEVMRVGEGLHRTRSVARNLSSLPLYRLMMDVRPAPVAVQSAVA
ncbi:hypothetical protein WA577_002043 [Blastocystis sp. JDR]